MKWAHDLLRDISADSLLIVRALAIAGFAQFLITAALKYHATKEFNMQEFGMGMGAVITAVGLALKLNARADDKPEGDKP